MADYQRIRRYKVGDASALQAVFDASVSNLGPLDYSAAQVEAWRRAGPDEAARRFFSRKGFAVRKKRTFVIGGVAMHNYAMAKRLQPEALSSDQESLP